MEDFDTPFYNKKSVRYKAMTLFQFNILVMLSIKILCDIILYKR